MPRLIKVLSIIVFLALFVGAFLTGDVFKVTRTVPLFSGSEYTIEKLGYNTELAALIIALSFIISACLYAVGYTMERIDEIAKSLRK